MKQFFFNIRKQDVDSKKHLLDFFPAVQVFVLEIA